MKQLAYALMACTLILFACKGTGSEKTADSPSKPKAPKALGAPRILFIGNSHTDFFVSLPKMFGELCEFNKDSMKVDELIEMGISLKEIYSQAQKKADEKFALTDADSNYYDYVVFQEKTPVALQEPDEYKASVKMYLEKIRKNSPGVVVLVYEVMSPVDFAADAAEFETYYQEMSKNAKAVVADNSNAMLYKLGTGIKDAYNGKHDYKYNPEGTDRLRFGSQTRHMLNDAGFMASTLLYATIFDKKPGIPTEMTFSEGTGDNDGQKKMVVKTAISNPDALLAIAMDNK